MKRWLLAILFFNVGSSWAYLSTEEVFKFKENKSTEQMVKMYIGGIMEGLWGANLAAKEATGKALFCLPSAQNNLQTEELVQTGYLALIKAKNNETLMQYMKTSYSKESASLTILLSLQLNYPCN